MAEHVQDSGRLAGRGKDPAPLLDAGHDAHFSEERQRLIQAEGAQGGQNKPRVSTVIVLDSQVGVAEVAAPIPGREDLLADSLHAFEHLHARAGARRGDCRREARGPPANDHHSPPSLRCTCLLLHRRTTTGVISRARSSAPKSGAFRLGSSAPWRT